MRIASLRSDANQKQGHIMMNPNRLIVTGAALALLPLSAAFAQTPPTAPAEQSQGTTFESLDTNSDGRISKDEAAVNENVKSQFSHYDVDGNGFIERAEVGQANSPPPATPQQ
jgi:hypothetical protein